MMLVIKSHLMISSMFQRNKGENVMKKVAKSISMGLLSSALLLAGCTSPTSSVPVMKNVSGYQTAYPTKVKGALHNVGMGWNALEEQTELGKMNLGHDGTLPEVDTIGIQTSWDIIEKEEGVFDWSLIDETIQYWTTDWFQIRKKYVKAVYCHPAYLTYRQSTS